MNWIRSYLKYELYGPSKNRTGHRSQASKGDISCYGERDHEIWMKLVIQNESLGLRFQELSYGSHGRAGTNWKGGKMYETMFMESH